MKTKLVFIGIQLVIIALVCGGCAVLDVLLEDEPEPRRGTLTLEDGTKYKVEEELSDTP